MVTSFEGAIIYVNEHQPNVMAPEHTAVSVAGLNCAMMAEPLALSWQCNESQIEKPGIPTQTNESIFKDTPGRNFVPGMSSAVL